MFQNITLTVAEIQGSQKPEGQADSGLVKLPEMSTIHIQKRISFASLGRHKVYNF